MLHPVVVQYALHRLRPVNQSKLDNFSMSEDFIDN